VHLPFCAHHCGYCDFAVAVRRDDRRAVYLDALARELERVPETQRVDTLFFGGGTPTFLAPRELERCFEIVRDRFPRRDGQECSIEANPGTLIPETLAVLKEQGVTRVSLGCQSFEPAVLKVLERDHTPPDAYRAMDLVRQMDWTVSLDLIFGVPGQSLEQWRRDLEAAITLEPDGIATYGLTFEKGTRLWKQRRDGEIQSLGEDRELAMYELAMDCLAAAGYEHVELSNFAKPGKACRHNQVYWANEAHWGFGLGAAEYVRGERRTNTRELDGYIRKALSRMDPAQDRERLPPRERALETIGQNLRRAAGIERNRFESQTGFSLDRLAGRAITDLTGLDLLVDDGVHVRLTRRGKCVADSVTAEFWKTAADCNPQ
jgi:oxygen-independent coproporphyrinogen-3 oxidase